jgi:hypothetical protein
MIGLLCVLLVGGCVAGMRGCARVVDPKVWSERVDEEPVKTRRMLSSYLQTATYEPESKLQVDGAPARVAVQDFTDGSIHVTLDGGAKRLVEIVVQVAPDGPRHSRVEVMSDATALAAAGDGDSPALHRRIRGQIGGALDAIDRQRPVGGSFSMARLIRDSGDWEG